MVFILYISADQKSEVQVFTATPHGLSRQFLDNIPIYITLKPEKILLNYKIIVIFQRIRFQLIKMKPALAGINH